LADDRRTDGDELDRRIAAAKAADERLNGDAHPLDGPAENRGWAMGVEFVGAVIVSGILGYLLDRWLGTRPWGMILFFFLGVATGMVNVYRAISGMGMAIGYKQRGGTPPQGVGYDDEDDD